MGQGLIRNKAGRPIHRDLNRNLLLSRVAKLAVTRARTSACCRVGSGPIRGSPVRAWIMRFFGSTRVLASRFPREGMDHARCQCGPSRLNPN